MPTHSARLRRFVAVLVLVSPFALGACGGLSEPYIASGAVGAGAVAPEDLDATLLLIGDAGERDEAAAPVLATLTAEARRPHGALLVAFLGDNAYPAGLPDVTDEDHALARVRIDAQVDAALDGGARALFLPGNHDWGFGDQHNARTLEREATRVLVRGGDRAIWAPKVGTPGPESFDLGTRVRLVVLDTERLLDATDAEPALVERTVEALAKATRATDGRHVVVLGHHPVATHGPHGGFHDSASQLSLPVIGSAVAVARDLGVADVDLSSPAYGRLRTALIAAFRRTEPLVYAAGHEHSLQFLRGGDQGARHLLVSGAGSPGRLTSVTSESDTVLAAPGPGFFRLDFLKDGRVRLEMIAMSLDGAPTQRTALWISTPTAAGAASPGAGNVRSDQ